MANIAQQEQMRKAIREAYSSEAWWAKVDKMSERQVFAVYTRLKSQKRI